MLAQKRVNKERESEEHKWFTMFNFEANIRRDYGNFTLIKVDYEDAGLSQTFTAKHAKFSLN